MQTKSGRQSQHLPTLPLTGNSWVRAIPNSETPKGPASPSRSLPHIDYAARVAPTARTHVGDRLAIRKDPLPNLGDT